MCARPALPGAHDVSIWPVRHAISINKHLCLCLPVRALSSRGRVEERDALTRPTYLQRCPQKGDYSAGIGFGSAVTQQLIRAHSLSSITSQTTPIPDGPAPIQTELQIRRVINWPLSLSQITGRDPFLPGTSSLTTEVRTPRERATAVRPAGLKRAPRRR